MNKHEDTVNCPVCGSVTEFGDDRLRLMMLRAYLMVDFVPAILHDARNALELVLRSFHGAEFTLEHHPTDSQTELKNLIEYNRKNIGLISTLTATVSGLVYYSSLNRKHSLAAIPKELLNICHLFEFEADIDFTPLENTEQIIAQTNIYVLIFAVVLKESLISLSSDRKPNVAIRFKVIDTCLETTFRLWHSTELRHEDRFLSRINWCINLAGGTTKIVQESRNSTLIEWQTPLAQTDDRRNK